MTRLPIAATESSIRTLPDGLMISKADMRPSFYCTRTTWKFGMDWTALEVDPLP